MKRTIFHVAAAAASASAFFAQELADPEQLKNLSIEELMQQQITSASRKEEPLIRSAMAIDVLTNEQIHRSGYTTIADSLRLAAGIHVARHDGRTWAISARGFNTTSANKLQAFMDGRSLYTPLYSGVFWSVQDYLLEDIDRIEVVRGPAAPLWGANAFNGMINIFTRSARDTQGTLINAGLGTEEQGFGGIRYGGQLSENTFYRVYAKFANRDALRFPSGDSSRDDSIQGQTGFRLDSDLSEENSITAQGDFYDGRLGHPTDRDSIVRGGNFLTRWTHRFDESADFQVRAYYDRTHTEVFSQFRQDLDTVDLDTQYRREFSERHELMAGFDYRLYDDTIENRTPAFSFEPKDRHQQLVGAFLRHEARFIPDLFGVTVGAKVEHNDFTGFEFQPGIRSAWTPGERNTVWAGVSRAVRTPTRFENDLRFPAAFNLVPTYGDFQPEEVLANEIGWRHRLNDRAIADISAYYNIYDRLRGFEFRPDGTSILSNELEGEGYGVETGVRVELMDWWRVRASFTAQDKELRGRFAPDPFNGLVEGNDPNYMARLHSSWDFPHQLFFDAIVRCVSALPNPHVDAYVELDLRLAWRPKKNFELAVSGLNLLNTQHEEFAYFGSFGREVERSGYIEVTWSF